MMTSHLAFLLLLPAFIAGDEETIGDQVSQRQVEAEFVRGLMLRTMDLTDGSWPVTADYACEAISTVDNGTDNEILRAAKGALDNGVQCGINMFDWAAKKEATESKRSARDRSRRSTNDDLLEALEELDLNLKKFLRTDKFRRSDTPGNIKNLGKLKTEMRQKLSLVREAQGLNRERRTGQMESRIVGGEESQEGKFPWLVAVGKKSTGLRCGGTLINSRWVVTAAHCFEDVEMPCSFNIRIGAFNWVVDDSGHHEDIEPELIVKHPDFDCTYLQNDIALVKLSREVKLSPDSYINSACILHNEAKEGDICVAAGWGARYEDDHDLPETVQEVELPKLSPYDCNFALGDSQFCAGSVDGGIDTCQGDSGGPLMLNRNDKWYLAGVTSFGYGCGRASWPGIYTDVTKHVDYIKSVINRF